MMVIFEKVSSNILRQRILSRRKGTIGVNYLKHLKSKYNWKFETLFLARHRNNLAYIAYAKC